MTKAQYLWPMEADRVRQMIEAIEKCEVHFAGRDGQRYRDFLDNLAKARESALAYLAALERDPLRS
jgi:hypothetical protein